MINYKKKLLGSKLVKNLDIKKIWMYNLSGIKIEKKSENIIMLLRLSYKIKSKL